MSEDQGRISLVLLPSGEQGESLLELAVQWARQGLLQRSIWLRPRDVGEGDLFSATVAQAGDSGPHSEPLRLLSRLRLHSVQVLVLQTPTAEVTADPEQIEAARRLKDCVTAALPRAQLDGHGIPHHVVDATWLNVIAPPTGLVGLEFLPLSIRGYSTLLASPEDRRAPGQLDGFVRPGDAHLAWALAQAASLLGLWMGVRERPLAEFERRFSEIQAGRERADLVMPFRTFARIVTAAPVARAEVAAAMASIMAEEQNVVLPRTRVAVEASADDRVQEFVDALQQEMMGSGFIEAYEKAEPPKPREMKVRGLASDFRDFAARELKALPREWSWRVKSRVRRRIQGTTEQGEGESGVVVVLEDNPPPDEFFRAEFEQRTSDNKERLHLQAPPNPNTSVPRMWKQLRGGSLALLDGSPMPAGLEQLDRKTDRGSRVVLPYTQLAVPRPDPWTWQFEVPRTFESIALADAKIHPGDPETADAMADGLDGAIEVLSLKREEMISDRQALEGQLNAVQEELAQIAEARAVLEAQLEQVRSDAALKQGA